MKGTLLISFVTSVLFTIQDIQALPQFLNDTRLDIVIDPPGTVIIVTPFPDVTTPGPPGPTTASPPTTLFPGQSTTTTPGPIPPIQGLPCGASIVLSQGNVVQMSSSNFGVGNYNPGETCNWNIQANQCRLEATCPCIDIPPSWNCIQGYLKIRTGLILDLEKFCGGNKPGQAIKSDTSEINIRFRASTQRTATGFTCFVSCIGPGKAPPTLPTVRCPNSKK